MKQRQITAKFLRFWWKYKFNISKPKLNFIDADGKFGSQCVDLIRQYCKEVYWYNMPSLSKARLLSNKILTPNKRREVIVWEEELKMWDIMSVDLIPKNEYWHILIVYKETKEGFHYIDQNGIWWAYKDWKVNNKKWNGVEKRFAKRWKFKILKVFRYA